MIAAAAFDLGFDPWSGRQLNANHGAHASARLPAAQFMFDPNPFIWIESRINDVQKRDQALLAGLASENPLGQFELLTGAGGKIFDSRPVRKSAEAVYTTLGSRLPTLFALL